MKTTFSIITALSLSVILGSPAHAYLLPEDVFDVEVPEEILEESTSDPSAEPVSEAPVFYRNGAVVDTNTKDPEPMPVETTPVIDTEMFLETLEEEEEKAEEQEMLEQQEQEAVEQEPEAAEEPDGDPIIPENEAHNAAPSLPIGGLTTFVMVVFGLGITFVAFRWIRGRRKVQMYY